MPTYCWWKKFCTSWYGKYTIICLLFLLYIQTVVSRICESSYSMSDGWGKLFQCTKEVFVALCLHLDVAIFKVWRGRKAQMIHRSCRPGTLACLKNGKAWHMSSWAKWHQSDNCASARLLGPKFRNLSRKACECMMHPSLWWILACKMQHTTMALFLNQLFVAIPTRPKFNKDTQKS